MTEPEQVVSDPNEDQAPSQPTQTQESQNSGGGKRYLVKTPWYINEFALSEEVVLNPKGVEVTEDQLKAALDGAKEQHMQLKYKEV